MTLQEELEFYRKHNTELREANIKLENDNNLLIAKNWNNSNKLEDVGRERDKFKSEIEVLKEEVKELRLKNVRGRGELLDKIKALEEENRDIRNKVINLKKLYKESLDKYYEQCMLEIAKAKQRNKHQIILECLNRNNGNKTKTAKELGMSRQALYQRLNKR